MKNVRYYPAQPNLIAYAESDCRAVSYSPIGNETVVDLARNQEVYAGKYCDNGRMTANAPTDAWKAAASALITAVDAHNTAEREAIRQRDLDALQARADRMSDACADMLADMDNNPLSDH